MRTVLVFDTTLRDGEQSPGCSMKLTQKLELAKMLEEVGVDVIEAGFPIASPDDFEAVKAIAKAIKNTTVAGFCRANTSDIACAWEAVRHSKRPRIHIFLSTSDIHITHKLKSTREKVLDLAAAAVSHAGKLCPEVHFIAEDATRTERGFLLKILSTACENGAISASIADTVGYAMPQEMAENIRFLKEKLPEHFKLGAHCHNDLGLALANTLAAVKSGADHFECSLGGIGERAGMTAMEEAAMALKTRRDFYNADTKLVTKKFYRANKLLSTIIDMDISPIKPIVGANAFAHEAGVHQHGMMANPLTYEIMKPQDVGLHQTRLVLGKHSGKSALKERLCELGYKISSDMLEDVFKRFKKLADVKSAITDFDIEGLVLGETAAVPEYTLTSFVVNSGTDITSTAVVRLMRAGKEHEHVARGETPVIAAFKAVDKIVKHSYPLASWSIGSISEGREALGESVVKILAGEKTVTGRGTHTDIVEACIKAYLSAINRALKLELEYP